mgnify:CR=1 FL=1
MGNGNDTLLLSRLCGSSGRVLSFDIQKQALTNTEALLNKEQLPKNYTLILDSHEHMDQYTENTPVSCIIFNLGYLPGGDHNLAQKNETSIPALTKALSLLKKGGLLSLCIYSGGDSGFDERDAVLAMASKPEPPVNFLVIKNRIL